MFCGKCGAQNPDGSAFCSECGAPLTADAPVTPAGGAAAAAPGTADKHKLIGIAAAGVAALVVIIIIIALCSGRSAKSAAKSFMEAVFDGDGEEIVDLLPGDVIKAYADRMGVKTKDAKETLEETYDTQFDGISEMMDKVKITVKVSGSEDYSGGELDDIVSSYKSIGVKVKDAKVMKVKLTLKYDGEKLELDSPVEVPVVKVGGSWYLDVQKLGSSFAMSLVNAITSSLLYIGF